MPADHVILLFSWILYGVLHSVLAARSVKARAYRLLGKAAPHYRLLYTLFAFFSLTALLYFQFTMQSRPLFSRSTFSLLAGVTAVIAGAVLMAICIGKYFMSLSGIRSLLNEEEGGTLMISGVHRYMRHPLYLGTFIFIWGLFLLFPLLSHLIACVVITVYTLLAIPFEEAKLVAQFGEDYRRYQRQVPRLLPLRRPFKAS